MKKLILSIIFLFLVFVSPYSVGRGAYDEVNAQQTAISGLTNVGYATFNLTAPGFNCDGFFEATQDLDSLHIAFLYNTFGNDFSCLKRLLADDRLETLEVALLNEPGHRNKRLGSYEFLKSVGSVNNWNTLVQNRDPALKSRLTKYVIPLQELLAENLRPETALLINPGLESNLSDAAGRVLVSWTRESFPSARIVWNPLRASDARRKRAKADLIEAHGFYPNISAPCVYNMDGMDVSYKTRPALGQRRYQEGQTKNWINSGKPMFQLMETYANACEVAFVWTAESNGLDEKVGGFVDPRKRKHNISTRMYKNIFKDIISVHKFGKIYPKTVSYSQSDMSVESSCNVVTSSFKDGAKGGKLLKQSEFTERGGVLILPREYSNSHTANLVKGTRIIDVYNNTGSYKDGRVLFRSNTSPTKYPFNTYLTLNNRGQKVCFKIPNPRTRID